MIAKSFKTSNNPNFQLQCTEYQSLIVLYVYYYFTDLYEFGGKRLNGIAVLSEMSQTKCVFEKLVEIQYIALTESI